MKKRRFCELAKRRRRVFRLDWSAPTELNKIGKLRCSVGRFEGQSSLQNIQVCVLLVKAE